MGTSFSDGKNVFGIVNAWKKVSNRITFIQSEANMHELLIETLIESHAKYLM